MPQIQRILATGSLDDLSQAEREYYSLMEMVRGLRARMLQPGGKKIVTKAGIIKLLKSQYGVSDWMARQIYSDALNFFYADEGVRPEAWAHLYAEKAEKMADAAMAMGRLREAKSFLDQAAKLRGCFKDTEVEIPEELLNQAQIVVYTTDAEAMGAPRADVREIERFVDALPEIPELTRDRIKEDAGVKKRNLLSRLAEDVKEFTPDDE